ncbi:hypothetical protein [Providencia heimbachae]|uniref:hypothetical protein n=1 Tax=Providencia heimbachae TaxID=333962 RepID=UPI002240BDE6|nr:hypothetical protein [Providencia heimbachae]
MEWASIPFDRKIYSQNPATSANRGEKRWIFTRQPQREDTALRPAPRHPRAGLKGVTPPNSLGTLNKNITRRRLNKQLAERYISPHRPNSG